MKAANYQRDLNGGTQWIYRFDNSYGASVVQSHMAYTDGDDEFELAVLKFHGKGYTNENWKLCYSTSITDDVIGYLTESDVNDLLSQIEALNSEGE